jgi:Arc/MetJ-type ribon-helix-helix transcriptional regulator
MAKPTTIRIPEDLLKEINEFVQELKLDRSAYLRELLRKGFSTDKQDRLLLKYARKELSQMEVCKELNWAPWEFLDQLKSRNLHLNVELEDWFKHQAYHQIERMHWIGLKFRAKDRRLVLLKWLIR